MRRPIDSTPILVVATLALIVVGCQPTASPTGSAPAALTSAGQTAPTPGASATAAAASSGPPANLDALVPAGTFTGPADPLDLTVETDDARAVSADVDWAGATLTATGGDGTTYTLTIPKGAVFPPVTISITPLTSIVGRGARAGGRALQGVQLEPSGLELLTPARLRVAPAQSIDGVDYVWFAYHGQGEDASLALAGPNADGLVLPIDHFSGAGIVRRQAPATGGDAESGMLDLLVDQVISRRAGDRLAGEVARAAAQERSAQLLGQEPPERTIQDVAEATQWRYLEEVVRPLLRVAANAAATCDDATALIAALNGASRQRQLLGISNGEEPSALDEAYQAVLEEAYSVVEAACRRDIARACRQSGDISAVVSRALAETRVKQLLGRADESEGIIPDFYQRILKWCAVYELTFVSRPKSNSGEYRIDPQIKGHLTLRLVGDYEDPTQWPPLIEGQTEGGLNPFLVSVSCSAGAAKMICAPGAQGMQPTRARISKIEFGHTERRNVGGREQVYNIPAEFELLFQPSAMILPFVVKADSNQVNSALEIFLTTFKTAHERDQDGEWIKIGDWQRANHPLLWKRTYTGQKRKEKTTFSDTTEFEFTHTPDPEP